MGLLSTGEIDWGTLIRGKKFTPSPPAWEDQVFYFLMLDRFSDGREKDYRGNDGKIVTDGSTPIFQIGYANNIARPIWETQGQGWKGGTLKGLESKIGYLSRMGITAVWISPIFKQVKFQDTYHGYGVQDFLSIDPHFGIADDLKSLVDTAHRFHIYVILDIILNHSGNVFSYDPDRYWTENGSQGFLDPRWDGNPYKVAGFNNAQGSPVIPFKQGAAAGQPDGAVWPEEFQSPGTFTCKGHITNWDHDPEFKEGDFCDLKDIHHGSGTGDDYYVSTALKVLCDCYKYWIAFADIDGFRIDTVKHMDIGATRYFASVIHEFTQSIKKERFYLIGEITGGRQRAFDTLESTGLDAALGIDDIPDKMEYLVKGCRNPEDYFNLFRNSLQLQKDSHVWFRDTVVTLFDDHDQVRKGGLKSRFCAGEQGWKVLLNVLGLNALTLGIPCIYYGSEQYFNGQGGSDVFLRECMFGGKFGSLQSQGYHFFNEESEAYKELAKILKIRQEKITLRRGRQYLRPISGNGIDFGLPRMIGTEIRSIIPWSRMFNDLETLVATNTDYDKPLTTWVTIDNALHKTGNTLTCLYSTDASEISSRKIRVEAVNGKAVLLTVPAAGFVIYE